MHVRVYPRGIRSVEEVNNKERKKTRRKTPTQMLKQNVTGLEFCTKKTEHFLSSKHTVWEWRWEKNRKKTQTNTRNDRGKRLIRIHAWNKWKKQKKTHNGIVSLRLGVWKNVYYQHRGEVSILDRLFACFVPFTHSRPTARSPACWNKRWARLWVCVAEIIPISFALTLTLTLTAMVSYTSIGFGYINICYDKNGHNR